MRFDIVVVGSLNQDITVGVPRIPAPGETVVGTDAVVGAGGKGANQAVAAARLGASVAMVGRVGDDAAGTFLRGELIASEVDITHVGVDESRSSGTALITVDEAAENSIVVSPGANHALTVEDVAAAAGAISGADVVLLQMEVPIPVVAAAAATAAGVVILNPAPAIELPGELLNNVDIVIPNKGELAMLGVGDSIEDRARGLAVERDVIVTLGGDGAFAVTRGGDELLAPAPRVEAIDSVGAGDCFCGAFGVAIADGEDTERAMRFATHAAALAVTRRGAQASMPYLHEVRALLGDG